jgi:hypothetical protein
MVFRARSRSSATAIFGVAVVVIAQLMGLGGKGEGAEAAGPSEWELKAAVICQITKFVEWPEPPATNAPVVIGVVGDGPLVAALERMVAAAPGVPSHALTIKKLVPSFSPTNVLGCHLLVLAGRLPEQTMNTTIKSLPPGILTVSDVQGFAHRGGMVGLPMKERQVQLEINLAACEQARLRLSSRLLRQAKIVSRNTPASP